MPPAPPLIEEDDPDLVDPRQEDDDDDDEDEANGDSSAQERRSQTRFSYPQGGSSRDRDDRGGQERIEEVPDWDGDLRGWRNYKRRVKVWLEGTSTKPDKQGARMLSRLSGDAWQCTEDIDLKLLRTQGSKYLLQFLEENLEVEEFHLVGRSMEDFFFAVRREPGEHIN